MKNSNILITNPDMICRISILEFGAKSYEIYYILESERRTMKSIFFIKLIAKIK